MGRPPENPESEITGMLFQRLTSTGKSGYPDVEALAADTQIASPNGWERGALQIFADSRGRRWKDELLVVWHNGRDDYEAGGNYLRQVRNQLGPAWLHSKECTIKPASAKPKPSSPGF